MIGSQRGSCRRSRPLRRRWWPRARARARALALTGPDGLLKLFTKNVAETTPGEESSESDT
ncbi:hypothetical protein BU204_37655 [Actinophytocola xanthii]|uniref:Uncharacterized protein n=1 Tax=Actinophytocola xanthii TaxID=1912961 RepID=A0A1Q8BR50_9PSEU|nr:hypothetical protein BU204_37655 [Actinophytocola xanthii]